MYKRQALDRDLATIAALVAVRRHARPAAPGENGRPLAELRWVIGSGGVLRHAQPQAASAVLDAVVTDYAGGWRTPSAATTVVDRRYLLFAVGLLAGEGYADTAAALARQVASAPSAP